MSNKENESFVNKAGRFMVFAAWIGLAALLTWFFSDYLDSQWNPNRSVVSRANVDEQSQVVLQRNRYGHYVASGFINGHQVVFLLDTGATHVSVPQHIAVKIGLQRGAPLEVSTANGIATVFATVLREVQLGNIVLQDVRADINPHFDQDEILLGMAFLKHLEFTQSGDTLTLRGL